jgi:hypothetical protein
MSDRTAWTIAVALAFAAVAVLLYRLGMVLLYAGSASSAVYYGVVGALFVTARTIVRDRDRPGLLLLAGAAVLGMAVAGGAMFVISPPLGFATLERRELPGFSVSLPSGELDGVADDYKTGKAQLIHHGNSSCVFSIAWMPGAADHELLELEARALMPAMNISGEPQFVEVAGAATARMDTDKGLFEVSMVPCGARNVQLISIGPRGIERLHRRVVESFACQADAAKDAAASQGGFPMAFDLPGWTVQDADPAAVQIIDPNGHSALSLQPTGPIDADMSIKDALGPIFRAMGVTAQIGDTVDGYTSITATLDKQPLTGFATLVRCPRGNGLVIGMSDTEQALVATRELVSHGHCLAPGEPAQQFPKAEPAGAKP